MAECYTPEEFTYKVKSYIESNPNSHFRFFIGDVFKEREPTLYIQVENYEKAKELLKQFIEEDYMHQEEKLKEDFPINIYFVIYEKKQTHPLAHL